MTEPNLDTQEEVLHYCTALLDRGPCETDHHVLGLYKHQNKLRTFMAMAPSGTLTRRYSDWALDGERSIKMSLHDPNFTWRRTIASIVREMLWVMARELRTCYGWYFNDKLREILARNKDLEVRCTQILQSSDRAVAGGR